MMTIGIDPGWATFGIAINLDGKTIFKNSYSPSSFRAREIFISNLNKDILLNTKAYANNPGETDIFIERFVAYSGINSSASEDILMLIGALDYFFALEYKKPTLVKAIDWKIKICQYLVKTKGFSNPGRNLDKKFSLLAAEVLSGEKFTSDHEADATCMSYLTEDILKGKIS